MILTVTPNPTLDRVVFVKNFQLGAIIRGEREILTPSGKGIDASLVLRALGLPTLATGLQSGRQGRLALELLDEIGVAHDFVWAEGETRHALVLVDSLTGAQSTISVATLHATERHLDILIETIASHLAHTPYVVLAGSLPPGWPNDAYCSIIRACHRAGVPALLDTSGAALAAALAPESDHPDILKINQAEFAGLFPPDDATPLVAQVIALRRQLNNEAVIVTLGAAGVLAATSAGVWRAVPPHVEVVNDAGAGDALAGCIAWARGAGHDWTEALRLGVAAAAAVVTTAGTAQCDKQTVERLLPLVEIYAET